MQDARRRELLWARRLENPRLRTAVVVAGFAAVTVVSCLVAYPRMFTGFGSYDDEGYMLIALKGFVSHGSLYDQTFSQYGPLYFELWGGLFSLFGIPIDHDGGRTVTIVVWVLGSLMLGLSTVRMTGSVLLGLLVQMLVFSALVSLVNEPMHPGGIICLLLAAIVAISCCVRDRASPRAMAALGGAVAALLLVKVNVGAFALAAVALACAASYPALSRRRGLRSAVAATFVAVPLLVMRGQLEVAWAREYALHVAAAALAVVVVLGARERERRPAAELGWLLGGFLTMTAGVCLVIVAAGTSPGGLLDGVVRQPLHQTDAFTSPLTLPGHFWAIDLLALGGAVVYRFASRTQDVRSGAWPVAIPLLAVAVGLAMAVSVCGNAFDFDPGGFKGYSLSLLGFCWVALVAAPPGDRRSVAFARLLLPLLAVLQALHAFPVAGSQVLWSSFLLIPVGAVCVAGGWLRLRGALGTDARRRGPAVVVALGAVLLTCLVVNATLREPLNEARAAYDASVPLGLPGAGAVHVGAPEADIYRQIAAAIRGRCPALVTLPGMNSFYLWAQQEPPTGENATAWLTLFDAARQRRVIAATRSIVGLCLLANPQLMGFWNVDAVPPGPLVDYLRRGFRPIATFGSYVLWQREGIGTS